MFRTVVGYISLVTLTIVALSTTSFAVTRRAKVPRVSQALADQCPKIQTLNPSQMFWKNNKPLRASSAINAPVIGYYKQMTLANNAGVRNPYFRSSATLLDKNGGVLTRMTPYPCRSDHCGGRVVSAAQTDVTRRIAVRRTGSPAGYVKVSRQVCIKIDDIGRCYGNAVDKGRPLCNQVVG